MCRTSFVCVHDYNENSYGVQGQDIYKSKQVRDKQIVRILGKVFLCLFVRYLIL